MEGELPALKITEEVIEFLVDSARYGDEDDVVAALQHGVPPDSLDADGRAALHMAAANGHATIADKLIQAGAIVKLLMDKGATAAMVNSAGRTPVDEALDRGFQELVDLINLYNTGGAGVSVEEEYDDPEEIADAPGADTDVFTLPHTSAAEPSTSAATATQSQGAQEGAAADGTSTGVQHAAESMDCTPAASLAQPSEPHLEGQHPSHSNHTHGGHT